jgi:hypothetical protein
MESTTVRFPSPRLVGARHADTMPRRREDADGEIASILSLSEFSERDSEWLALPKRTANPQVADQTFLRGNRSRQEVERR